MGSSVRIEQALESILARATVGSPPLIAEAARYALFPGGARIRPKLCLSVAKACGDSDPEVTDAAASAIEFLHCASLIHDDLPCFDDAPTRRGKPSVHCAFGEPVALLAGDALIVLAFESLARGAAAKPDRMSALLQILSRSVNMSTGIIAGQAWECEPTVVLADYQRAKTGALFIAATTAGAIAAGASPVPWRDLGDRLGEAYQVADDLHDAASTFETLGKPVGRDEALDRPSAVRQLGLDGAIQRLKSLVSDAIGAIPEVPGAEALRTLIRHESKRFVPRELAQLAA